MTVRGAVSRRVAPPAEVWDIDDAAPDPRRAGVAECAAIVVALLGTLFLWAHGLGAATVAGLVPLVGAFAQLAVERRLAAGRDAAWDRRLRRALWPVTPVSLALLPALLTLRALGVAPAYGAGSPADLWLGAGMYFIAILELVDAIVHRLVVDTDVAAVATPADDNTIPAPGHPS